MAGRTRNPKGRTGSTLVSNVVHLRPRKWLESEDELVPIGNAAAPADAGQPPAPPERTGGSGAPVTGAPPSAWLGSDEDPVPIGRGAPAAKRRAESSPGSDFWGEDAAYVQDALDAPVLAPLDPPASAPLDERVSAPLAEPASTSHATGFAHQVTPRFAAFVAVAGCLAALVAMITSSALTGSTAPTGRGARSASRGHSSKLADLRSQVSEVVSMLKPAHIPQPVQRRAHAKSPRAVKKHAAAAVAAPPTASVTPRAAATTSGPATTVSQSTSGSRGSDNSGPQGSGVKKGPPPCYPGTPGCWPGGPLK